MIKTFDCLETGGINEEYINELRNTMVFKMFPNGCIYIQPNTIPWKALVAMKEWDYDLMMNPRKVGDLGTFGGKYWIPVYFMNECQLFKDIKDECCLKPGEEISYNIPKEVIVDVYSALGKAQPSERNINLIGEYYVKLKYKG